MGFKCKICVRSLVFVLSPRDLLVANQFLICLTNGIIYSSMHTLYISCFYTPANPNSCPLQALNKTFSKIILKVITFLNNAEKREWKGHLEYG